MAASCMGGWCSLRENCRHYHAEGAARLRPMDRLCEAGTRDAFEPIFFLPKRDVWASMVHSLDEPHQEVA